MSRSLLLVVALAFSPTAAFAALDPEVKQPYRLRVVLHIGKHRLLTDVFKDQIERELRDGLQAALGDMAQVEIVRDHPRLAEVLDRSLQSLDGWKEVADLKTHFVLIDFVNDQYEVRARQYDGLTGQASPVVRSERVPDRGFVARTAGLLAALDFGLVGTVTEPGDGPTVRLALKGGGLGGPLERWVKKGDVFALVRINQGSAGPWANRVPWALLQVEEASKDGACVCRLYHRHPDPLALGPGTLGYRALKLGTTQGPLQLRFVEAAARTLTPRPNLQVHVRRSGFTGEEAGREQGTTDADGFVQAGRAKPYENLAFVTVIDGGVDQARIPVAIVDDRPVLVPISVQAETSTPLQFRRNLWVRRVYENLLAQTELFKQLNELAAKNEHKLALEKAQTGLKAIRADVEQATRELGSLRDASKNAAGGASIDLADGEQRIRDLQKIQQQLEGFITGLEEAIKVENDPTRRELRAKIERGGLLENEAEFGKALELYEEVLKSGIDFPKLQERYKKLSDVWQIKDDRHRQARAFIYDAWPKLERAGLKQRLPEAQAALGDCKRVGDTLSPLKLLKGAVAHVAKLNEQEQALNPTANPDDAKTAETIVEVREGLRKLIQEINDFLDPQPK